MNRLRLLDRLRAFDFLSPLALRLYLAPIFLATGLNKATHFDETVAWFGNPEWGLGLPAPGLNALMATATELLGAVLLLLGLGVRFVSIALMGVMVVAALTVHLPNGWFVIADPASCLFHCDGLEEAVTRLERARSILRDHGDYAWLTAKGSFVVLNNGVEFVAAYFIMLLTLFFQGGGRHVSLDHWIGRWLAPARVAVEPEGGRG
ncbi:MAG: DoxX family protein [Myxococcota bacterium]